MALLKATNVISGREGSAYATIDGSVEELMYIKKLDAVMRKKKSSVPILGQRSEGVKTNGWVGSGTMTVYYITTRFRQMMSDYHKQGKDLYFDVQVVNRDPVSEAGSQTVLLKNVNLDAVSLARLDVENTALDEKLEFSFDDFEIIESFSKV